MTFQKSSFIFNIIDKLSMILKNAHSINDDLISQSLILWSPNSNGIIFLQIKNDFFTEHWVLIQIDYVGTLWKILYLILLIFTNFPKRLPSIIFILFFLFFNLLLPFFIFPITEILLVPNMFLQFLNLLSDII